MPKSDNDGKRTRLQDACNLKCVNACITRIFILTNNSEDPERAEPEPDDERYDSSVPTTNDNLSIEERIALLQEEVKRVAKRSTPMLPQEYVLFTPIAHDSIIDII